MVENNLAFHSLIHQIRMISQAIRRPGHSPRESFPLDERHWLVVLIGLARPHPAPTTKEKIMSDHACARHKSQPRFWNLLATALTPWLMLSGMATASRTYAELSRLDDCMLKDIGLSRGGIHAAIRDGRRR